MEILFRQTTLLNNKRTFVVDEIYTVPVVKGTEMKQVTTKDCWV